MAKKLGDVNVGGSSFGLHLPTGTVYVIFADNHKEVIASSDTLTREEAERFRKDWNNFGGHGKVTCMCLKKAGAAKPAVVYTF